MEHTKGKWTAKEWTYKNGVLRKIIIQTDKNAVAEVLGLYRPDDLENKEMKANARLIADAPRLAEENERLRGLLTSALPQISTYCNGQDECIACQIRAELADAEGRE